VAKGRAIHESGYERQEGDFYPTPAWVTECLPSNVTLRGPVWEPCCGDGALAKVLSAAGHEVVATDLVDRGFGRGGVDLLKTSEMPDGSRALVTNPPYGDGGARSTTGKAAPLMLALPSIPSGLPGRREASSPCWCAPSGLPAGVSRRC
jgi:hypothetical protein